jgi:hypothetical protein
MRTKLVIDIDEPKCAKSRHEIVEPMRAYDRSDSELAMVTCSYTDSTSVPTLANWRTDKEDPTIMKLTTETGICPTHPLAAVPRAIPWTLNAEPRRTNERTENEDAIPEP